jgi:hypothetical protein
MDEHDWRPGAVVLIVELDGLLVFPIDLDIAHKVGLHAGFGECDCRQHWRGEDGNCKRQDVAPEGTVPRYR